MIPDVAAHLPSIVALSLGCSAGVALIGVGILRVVRRPSQAVWFAAVVLVTVASVAVGVTGAAEAMFVSDHDLQVTLVVLAVSGLTAAAVAFWLGRPTVTHTAALREAARWLGEESYRPVTGSPTSELEGLATELTATHQRLIEGRERERAVERSRRELVAWVSHDLRTPLAGIRAMAEALEDGVVGDAETVARYHSRMRTDADRLAGMVDDLFELARVHAGALKLSMSRVPLADLISDAVAAADPLARAKGVRLRGHADPGVPVEVDVREVGRVLTNLLVNAIRHTPGDGTVEVVGGIGAGDVGTAYVAVHDACGGIPVTDLDRIFEVGYRGEPARTPQESGAQTAGAGLGLAIARGIVEAHDGGIAVSNTEAGCRFVVTLPTAT